MPTDIATFSKFALAVAASLSFVIGFSVGIFFFIKVLSGASK